MAQSEWDCDALRSQQFQLHLSHSGHRPMSNPDRLMREAAAHAEYLIESRGVAGARALPIHCANRTTDGFWSRVVQAIEAIDEAEQAKEEAREASHRRALITARSA